jgi:hypothetical protein
MVLAAITARRVHYHYSVKTVRLANFSLQALCWELNFAKPDWPLE